MRVCRATRWIVLTAALLAPPACINASAADSAAVREYTSARRQYAAEVEAYWTAVGDRRRLRVDKRRKGLTIAPDDYVLTQPPAYSGPRKPEGFTEPVEEPSARPRKYIPVEADFLKSAAQHFSFVPERPRSEIEMKHAYVRVAAAAGLTEDQVVRIYAFETGGNGKYDIQAGVGERKTGRAISSALGYNQLLHINAISLLAENGDRIVAALQAKAVALSGAAKAKLQGKIAIVRRMIEFSRTVPVRWAEHEKLADTQKGFAPHALNLDIDIAPLLQTQKLVNSVAFARRNGIARPLTAAELEIMNFSGDGNGIDIVTMPAALRARVPTANFFRQASYYRNPVVIRNNVVATLLAATDARMDRASKQQGAKEMAALFP